MTQEINIQSALAELERIYDNLQPEEERPIPIILAIQYALPIKIFLNSVNSTRLKRLKGDPKAGLKRGPMMEDMLSTLVTKFDKAIGVEYEPKVYLDINRAELDEMGEVICEEHKRLVKAGNALKELRRPVYESYLVLEEEYIRSDGLENNELSQKVKNLLKEPNRKSDK